MRTETRFHADRGEFITQIAIPAKEMNQIKDADRVLRFEISNTTERGMRCEVAGFGVFKGTSTRNSSDSQHLQADNKHPVLTALENRVREANQEKPNAESATAMGLEWQQDEPTPTAEHTLIERIVWTLASFTSNEFDAYDKLSISGKIAYISIRAKLPPNAVAGLIV